MKTILNLNHKEAYDYFINPKQYCTIDLPEYFSFDDILKQAERALEQKDLQTLIGEMPKEKWPQRYDDVNYSLISNKNAKYQWRRLELIHPVFFVSLVKDITEADTWNQITQRFKDFKKDKRITCCSLPLIDNRKDKVIQNWWNAFEQRSIACSVDYSYMGQTDIENCYSSIYTHTIAWAIHTRPVAKKAQDDHWGIIGNRIDSTIQRMHCGQTNGIPQGSCLMDFIAEIVLGYADELLSEKLIAFGDDDFKIIRYRDDYRIFSNDLSVIEEIIKQLTIVLALLNLNINGNKTLISDNIIVDSIKLDKNYNLSHPVDCSLTLQKRLMAIYNLSLQYPNSGSVKRELSKVLTDCFHKLKKRPNSYEQLVAIVIEIMRRNPSVYPIGVAILCDIFHFLEHTVTEKYIRRILNKYRCEPFSHYLEIWLQRITLTTNKEYEYDCELCKKVYGDGRIWNSEWMRHPLNEEYIVNQKAIKDIAPTFTESEIKRITLGYDE